MKQYRNEEKCVCVRGGGGVMKMGFILLVQVGDVSPG